MDNDLIFTGLAKVLATDTVVDAGKIPFRRAEILHDLDCYVYAGPWEDYEIRIAVHAMTDELMDVEARVRDRVFECEDLSLEFHGHPEPSLYN